MIGPFFTDITASNKRNDVKSVKTNPTLFAERTSAIVRTAETVKILLVKHNEYNPKPYKKIIGSLAQIVVGSKNQNSPTPSVNIIGKMRVKSVAFFPRPSFKDHTNNRSVASVKRIIGIKLCSKFEYTTNTKPKDNKSEVATKRCRLLMHSCIQHRRHLDLQAIQVTT